MLTKRDAIWLTPEAKIASGSFFAFKSAEKYVNIIILC